MSDKIEKRKTGGGSATAAGMDFQNRIAAWLMVRLLAEQHGQPLWEWPADSSLRYLLCETDQPVDDLLVANSNGGFAFIQAKRSLSGGRGQDSILGSVFDQFVQQFTRPAAKGADPRQWERVFDPDRDRLVLIIGPGSSGTVTDDMPSLLAKVRALPKDQSVAAATLNASELALRDVLQRHAENAWQRTWKTTCSERDFTALLRAIYVEALAVEAGESSETNAKDTLRRSILMQAGQADLAWAKLIEIGAWFSKSHGGGDRTVLVKALTGAGVVLKTPASYTADVEKMRNHTRSALKSLARLSVIRSGRTQLKVKRRSTDALLEFVERQSLLLIGEPGAGKSGALHDIGARLQEAGAAVICLITDEIAATTPTAFQQEFQLEHALPEVIQNWGGTVGPVYFITDALDAARTDHSGEMLRRLIESALELGEHCRVIASIRMFDLRHDSRLRGLFHGEPHAEFHADEFAAICHFQVPRLERDELNQIASQAPDLGNLVQAILAGGNEEMKNLVTVPFNLRLLGELLGEGVDPASLSGIQTQGELLDRYWTSRVLKRDGLGDAREVLLRRIAEDMFKTRLLHVSRAKVVTDAASSPILQGLLSEEIIQEHQPGSPQGLGASTLKFPHHLLFDYGLSRLLFRVPHRELVDRIAGDPDCVVAFRPSLALHFRHLWAASGRDRASFWELLTQVESAPAIPLVGKVIAPVVAVELFRDSQETAALFKILGLAGVPSALGRDLRVQVVARLTGALAAKGSIEIHNGELTRWSLAAETLSGDLETFLYPLRHLVSMLSAPADQIPVAAQIALGTAARRLLRFALAKEQTYDRGTIRVCIEGIARTFGAACGDSGACLRLLIEPDHVPQHGHSELFFIAQEVPRIARFDSALVIDIYRTAFAAATDSQKETQMGASGRLLALRSNVRQDWQSVHYALAKAFPKILAIAPVEAARAAMGALNAYVERRHPPRENARVEEFTFRGKSAKVIADFSSIWDAAGSARSGDSSAVAMLNSIQSFLMAGDEPPAELGALLDLFAQEGKYAAAWRKLLQIAAKRPEKVGIHFTELLSQASFLRAYDLMEETGHLLTALYPGLSEAERLKIEAAILSIKLRDGDDDDSGQYTRDRYLGCLPTEWVASPAAQDRLKALSREGGPPANSPMFEFSRFEEGNVSSREFLRHQGVKVDDPANRELLDLIEQLKNISGEKILEESSAVWFQRLVRANELLGNQPAADAKVRESVDAYLAGGCARVLQTPPQPPLAELTTFALGRLLEWAETTETGPLTTDAKFDDFPSWGMPNVLVSTVEGLMQAKEIPLAEAGRVTAAVERLSQHPEASVRYLVSRHLNAYYASQRDLMWRLLAHFAEDPSTAVLTSVVVMLSHLRGPQAAEITLRVFSRSRTLGKNKQLCTLCVGQLLVLALRDRHAPAIQIVEQIMAAPWDHREEALQLTLDFRSYLAFGPMTAGNREELMRRRAQAMLLTLLQKLSGELKVMNAEHKGVAEGKVPQEVKDRVSFLHEAIDSISDQVYFASGAFEEKNETKEDDDGPHSVERRQRFWHEMRPILELLATSYLPTVAFHQVETLGSLLEFEPKPVFLLIKDVVVNARDGGFQFESMAADLAVKIVQGFVATYPALLKSDKECRDALVAILDTFVAAGWPAAQRLTYGLEEIFR